MFWFNANLYPNSPQHHAAHMLTPDTAVDIIFTEALSGHVFTFSFPQFSREFFVVFSKSQIADLVITEKRGKKWWILYMTTYGFHNDQTKRWQVIVTVTMSVSVSINGFRWKRYRMILLKCPTLVMFHTFHLKVKNHPLSVTSVSEKVKTVAAKARKYRCTALK